MAGVSPDISVHGHAGMVKADPEMLRAVLMNLVLNACQAEPGGPVEVRMSSHEGMARLQVLDRGPGIPEHVRERVFEPFVTTKSGGTGLGLTIVKRLAEMQGGSVSLRAREEGGTLAEVTLPAKP
jgi:signal transduction histidine kinase